MQSSLAGCREEARFDLSAPPPNGVLKRDDFIVCSIKPIAGVIPHLAVVSADLVGGKDFEGQKVILPQSFRPVSLGEVRQFVNAYKEQNGLRAPNFGWIHFFTSDFILLKDMAAWWVEHRKIAGNRRVIARVDTDTHRIIDRTVDEWAHQDYNGGQICIAVTFSHL